MIAWNGCEKLLNNSSDIVYVDQQDERFFENLAPSGKCELGESVDFQIKMLHIKV